MRKKTCFCKKLVLYLQIDKKILVFISILEFLIHMNFFLFNSIFTSQKCVSSVFFLGVVANLSLFRSSSVTFAFHPY